MPTNEDNEGYKHKQAIKYYGYNLRKLEKP